VAIAVDSNYCATCGVTWEILVAFLITRYVLKIFGLKMLLTKKKNIENDNGLNEIYSKNGKGKLHLKFHRKNGALNGKLEVYNIYGTTPWLISNWNEGKLHGELKEWFLGDDFFKRIETWENGRLISWKSFYTIGAKKGQLSDSCARSKENLERSCLQEELEKELIKFKIKKHPLS